MGVTNLVVAPQNWDERGQRVKTDGRDARELCQRLERWVHGNRCVFSLVRVPTPDQEQRRAVCRQRGFVMRARNQAASRGRSLLLTQGYRVRGRWWGTRSWAQLRPTLPEPLRTQVGLWQQTALQHETTTRQLQKQIEALAGQEIPVGIGAMSWVNANSEVLEWNRFRNRRAVGSYTGLCPSEHSSGGHRQQGSINRHGNPRLRHVLIEMAWRLLRLQPNCLLFDHFPQLRDPQTDKRRRKRLIVAAARRLAIDLWRLNTGQTTTTALRLKMPPPKEAAAN
jgi:transposase